MDQSKSVSESQNGERFYTSTNSSPPSQRSQAGKHKSIPNSASKSLPAYYDGIISTALKTYLDNKNLKESENSIIVDKVDISHVSVEEKQRFQELASEVLQSYHRNPNKKWNKSSNSDSSSNKVGVENEKSMQPQATHIVDNGSNNVQTSSCRMEDLGVSSSRNHKNEIVSKDTNTADRKISPNPSQQQQATVSTAAIFPMKLHDLLDSASTSERACITWMPCGTMWKVLDTEELEKNMLSKYFRHSKYTSFNRQVNLWGFTRIIKGNNTGCYCHPLFKRDDRNLCLKMKRKQEKNRGTLSSMATATSSLSVIADAMGHNKKQVTGSKRKRRSLSGSMASKTGAISSLSQSQMQQVFPAFQNSHVNNHYHINRMDDPNQLDQPHQLSLLQNQLGHENMLYRDLLYSQQNSLGVGNSSISGLSALTNAEMLQLHQSAQMRDNLLNATNDEQVKILQMLQAQKELAHSNFNHQSIAHHQLAMDKLSALNTLEQKIEYLNRVQQAEQQQQLLLNANQRGGVFPVTSSDPNQLLFQSGGSLHPNVDASTELAALVLSQQLNIPQGRQISSLQPMFQNQRMEQNSMNIDGNQTQLNLLRRLLAEESQRTPLASNESMRRANNTQSLAHAEAIREAMLIAKQDKAHSPSNTNG